MQRSKPNLPASFIRASACETPRISPANPTSPKKIVFGSMTCSRQLDATAAMMPRSTAGSSTWTPPASKNFQPESDWEFVSSLASRSKVKDDILLFRQIVVLRGLDILCSFTFDSGRSLHLGVKRSLVKIPDK